MKISPYKDQDGKRWNDFIKANFPTIGAFLQTYEWGEFQKKLGREVERYFVTNGGGPVAAFTTVRHPLPFGRSYLYTPRGPVFAPTALKGKQASAVLNAIALWAKKNANHNIFFRLEPPTTSWPEDLLSHNFSFPAYYVQPRHNLAINLLPPTAEILGSFHSSTRSNMARAKRRGVSVRVLETPDLKILEEFFKMSHDTADRNGGKNIYPGRAYFETFFKDIPVLVGKRVPDRLYQKIYLGLENGEPAAIHTVLFFGDTATYIYGAGYRASLASKVTSYLHWYAMEDAKALGCTYYDLGGIDEKKWPSLTSFKRQFRGEEFSYVGNIDILLQPVVYRLYNFIRSLRHFH